MSELVDGMALLRTAVPQLRYLNPPMQRTLNLTYVCSYVVVVVVAGSVG